MPPKPQNPVTPKAGGSLQSKAPPARRTLKPRTARFMFVCATPNIKDEWMFGNFFGITQMFRQVGVVPEGSAYWNCFPLEEYFASGNTEVRFGKKFGVPSGSRGEWEPRFKISAYHIRSRGKYWIDKDPNNLAMDIVNKLTEYAQLLEEDDIFTFFITSHGSSGSIKVGNDSLRWYDFTSSFTKFKPGVRINFIIQSCSSGSIIDRLCALGQERRYMHASAHDNEKSVSFQASPGGTRRNSVFTGAFVASMEEWFLRNYSQGTFSRKKLGPHISEVDQNGRSAHATPQSFTDEDLHAAALDILFTQYREVVLHTSERSFRKAAIIDTCTPSLPSNPVRRVEPPEPLPTESAIDEAAEFIEAERALVEDMESEEDVAHDTDYHKFKRAKSIDTKVKFMAECLAGLRWRFRIQEPLFMEMLQLISTDTITVQALRIPMDLLTAEPSIVGAFRDILEQYEKIVDMDHPRRCRGLEGNFSSPLGWLACLLARSNWKLDVNRVRKLDGELRTFPCFLGPVNDEIADKIFEGYLCSDYVPKWPIKPPTKISTGPYASRSPQYCFWLPRGKDLHTSAKDALQRYLRAQKVYNGFFGASTWKGFKGGSWSNCEFFIETLKEFIENVKDLDAEIDHSNIAFGVPIHVLVG